MTQREQIEQAAKEFVQQHGGWFAVGLGGFIDFALAQVEKATADIKQQWQIDQLSLRHVRQQLVEADHRAREECAGIVEEHELIESAVRAIRATIKEDR